MDMPDLMERYMLHYADTYNAEQARIPRSTVYMSDPRINK